MEELNEVDRLASRIHHAAKLSGIAIVLLFARGSLIWLVGGQLPQPTLFAIGGLFLFIVGLWTADRRLQRTALQDG